MKKILAITALLLLLVPVRSGIKPIEVKMSNTVVDSTEMECLARNIFYEAPTEPYLGKVAVAIVTMNRVRHPEFPKTVCGVVYQKNRRGCQFSWTCGPKTKFNSRLYKQAVEIARTVLTNDMNIVSLENALYFHNTSIEPNWTFAKPIVQIGRHIFYEPNT